jgi:predicted nucleotidyltransferase component of viral defense system
LAGISQKISIDNLIKIVHNILANLLRIMEQTLSEKLAAEIEINAEKIVREEWEVIILKELFDSPIGDNLIFRGGTALRLCYGSPRFSDDLDFSELKNIPTEKFNSVINKMAEKFSTLAIVDLWSKYYTHIAEFKIKEYWLSQPFRIKIEIRKGEIKNKEFELKLISSPVTPLQALGNTATMKQIFQEKILALKQRKAARDLFDIWYLSQQLKTEIDTKKYNFDRKILRSELRKYLPQKFWKVVETL